MRVFKRILTCLAVLSTPLILAAATPARAQGPSSGCLTIAPLDAAGGACRAIVRNGCGRPLAVAVSFQLQSLGFTPNRITSAGLDTDHHGEPAYGGYSSSRSESASETADLAPGEAKTFERAAPDGERVVTGCRVVVTAR